ncbi:hypothetical protein LZ30DRAFT_814341 [Colletotrichum cereale]|nr:hypothetical protein LZ30DRAFT_814341 [Colletotrichum cereale]
MLHFSFPQSLSIQWRGLAFTTKQPKYAKWSKTPIQQKRTALSKAYAMLASWFGTIPRTLTALNRKLASVPVCRKNPGVCQVTPKELNVFYCMDLFVSCDVFSVSNFIIGTRANVKRKRYPETSLLVQAVPRRPPTGWQKGSEQQQSGHFDLTSYFMTNQVRKLISSPKSYKLI